MVFLYILSPQFNTSLLKTRIYHLYSLFFLSLLSFPAFQKFFPLFTAQVSTREPLLGRHPPLPFPVYHHHRDARGRTLTTPLL